jgi:hypothetical protein
MENTGVTPLPPQKPTTGRDESWGTKVPPGFIVEHVAPARSLSHRHLAAGHLLDGDRGRHHLVRSTSVAAGQFLTVDEGAEHAELAGLVGEQVGVLGGHFQHERAGVVGLLHDLLHPQRVVAVCAQYLIVFHGATPLVVHRIIDTIRCTVARAVASPTPGSGRIQGAWAR